MDIKKSPEYKFRGSYVLAEQLRIVLYLLLLSADTQIIPDMGICNL